MHDLDTHDEAALRSDLTTAVASAQADVHAVVIPKREIEAWLLYDRHAISAVFHHGKLPRLPGNPELLADPKKHLRDLIWATYRKDYLNVLHNPKIAKNIDLSHLAHCRSFAPYPVFSTAVRNALVRAGRVRR